MQPFDYITPHSHAEASTLLANGRWHEAMGPVLAFLGGTDLLVRARAGQVLPACVVDLKGLPGMREIRATGDGGLAIGAGCTMNQVAGHPWIRARYGLLAQACGSVASYQLRNRATLGGNCCNASPAADSAPALYCLDAAAEIYGPDGVRCLPIAEFFLGPRRTALRKGEFLTGLLLPPAPDGAVGVFHKLGRTQMGDIATVSVAVYAWRQGPALSWRLALGAVGPTPLYAPEAAAALAAGSTPAGIAAATELAARAARPIDDLRASAAYRRAMVKVFARRGIEAVLQSCSRVAV